MSNTLNFGQVNLANKAEWLNSFITLPIFNYQGIIWKGASEVITQFNYTATKNFTIRTLPTKPTNVNFCLVIRYRIGDNTYRYKLWSGVGETLNEPLYNGQIIKKNFVLEIWNTQQYSTVSLVNAINVKLSIRKIPFTYASLDDYADNNYVIEISDQKNVQNTPTLSVADTALLSAQYKADALNFAEGAAVTTWVDSSGNGNDLVFSNSNVNYSLVNFGINNKPQVRLYRSGLITYGATIGAVQAIYMALRINSLLDTRTIYDDGARLLVINSATGNLDLTYNGSTISLPLADLVTIPIIVVMYRTNGPFTINNMEIVKMNAFDIQFGFAQSVSANFNNPATTKVSLGDASVDVGLNKVDIAEVLAFSSGIVITGAGRDAAIKGYLAMKYGGGFALPMVFNSDIPWLSND